MITRVFALPYTRMKQLVTTQAELLDTHYFVSCLGSTNNEGQAQILPPDSDRWVTLRFDDINSRGLAAMTPEEAARYTIFSDQQADRIIDLVEASQRDTEQEHIFLVNCAAGVCRSGAVVSFIQEIIRLDWEQFRRDNPNVAPNDIVLKTLRARWIARNP